MSRTSHLLLRFGLAFAFFYPAYGFWTSPNDWVGYIPSFLKNLGASEDVLILAIAGFHLVIALWLLSGWRVRTPAVLAALFLGSVVYFNWGQLDVLFRDISLALAALALATYSSNRW